MRDNIIIYKGCITAIHYDVNTKILYGKIENIIDLVTFESDNAQDIIQQFHNAVDDYIHFRANNAIAIDNSSMPSISKQINKIE